MAKKKLDLPWILSNWFGIFTAALTLAGLFGGLVKIGEWARLILEHWAEFVHFVWKMIFFFIPEISKLEAVLLTFAALLSTNFVISGGPGPGERKFLSLFIAIAGVVILSLSLSLGLLDAFSRSWNSADYELDLVRQGNSVFAEFLSWIGAGTLNSIIVFRLPTEEGNTVRLVLSEVISDFLMLSVVVMLAVIPSIIVNRGQIAIAFFARRLWLIIFVAASIVALGNASWWLEHNPEIRDILS